MSNVQKVITANGTEHLSVRMTRENLALICEDRSRRHLPYRVIRMNPCEAWELVEFILTNIPCPLELLKSALLARLHEYNKRWFEPVKSVFCQVNEEPVPPASSLPPVQDVPGRSNTQGPDCPDSWLQSFKEA